MRIPYPSRTLHVEILLHTVSNGAKRICDWDVRYMSRRLYYDTGYGFVARETSVEKEEKEQRRHKLDHKTSIYK